MLNKKAVSFEKYVWFLVIIAMIVMTYALVAYFMRTKSIDFSTIGERALDSERALAFKEGKLMTLGFMAEHAAYKAALKTASTGGIDFDKGGYQFFWRAPIVITSDLSNPNIDPTQYFLDLFSTSLRQELEKTNMLANAKLEDARKSGNTARIQLFENSFYMDTFPEKSISAFNDSVYGTSLTPDRIIINSTYEGKNLGVINISFTPWFHFVFQNYSLDDYSSVLYFLKNQVYPAAMDRICAPDDELLIELNELNASFSVLFNEYCLEWYNDKYFAEYYKYQSKQAVISAMKKVEPGCALFICIKDKRRLVQGQKPNGDFLVDHPAYNYAIASGTIDGSYLNELPLA